MKKGEEGGRIVEFVLKMVDEGGRSPLMVAQGGRRARKNTSNGKMGIIGVFVLMWFR